MAFSPRFGDISPFIRPVDRDDDRYGGIQFGFVTYHRLADDQPETYKVTLSEFGGRSDHLAEPLMAACGAPIDALSVDAPLASDAELLRERPQVTEKPAPKTEAKTAS